MSICEHMIESGQSPEDKLLNIQNELVWGLTYRNYKENEKHKPMLPVHSPINIPFELCRAEMLLRNKKTLKMGYSLNDVGQERGTKLSEDEDKHSTKKFRKPQKRKISTEKPSLLDRNVWSQSKYMNFLSIPNPKFYEEPKEKKFKKRCELEPCPPRFVQLAVPNKRKVFANWKEYAHFLPTEMLMRFEEILHTDQNLAPREARYYYKKLDREKREKLKKKRRLEKKKKLEKQKDSQWLNAQIDMLAKDILNYIRDEPLFTLNYKQMLLSDGILDRLETTKTMKKPSRKTKNHCKKTIIEVSDKFAIWIDTLTRFVDVQAIESDEDIPPLSISSLSEEGEGESEGESEYEYSSEEEIRDDQLFEHAEGMWGEEGDVGEMDELEGREMEALIENLFKPGEGEDVTDLDNMLNELDGDVLEKLIKILGNCSDEFLDGEIDPEKMPDVRYRDVLDRLKALRDGLLAEDRDKPFLEQIMIDWAIKNDPDNVNDDILRKIHEVAGLLGDLIGTKKPLPTEEYPDVEGDGTEVGKENVAEGEEVENKIVEDEESKEDPAAEAEGGDEEKGADEDEAEKATEGKEEEETGTPTTIDIGEAEEGLSRGTLLDEIDFTDTEGGVTPFDEELSDLEGEEGITSGFEEVAGLGEGISVGGGEEEEEIAVLFEPSGPEEPRLKGIPADETGIERLEGRVIKGHKPLKTFEHSPDTVCCLSLKTWAVWLLEITHNAHNWTQWMSCVIQKVREYAATVRGDVRDANGQIKVLRKAEWRKFITETEESVVAWRQYSAHVKDLSQSIIENFHDKKVNCCPKCLQDHLITNVVIAHDTLQALTEAISCAAYWQRCLDNLVEKTCDLTQTAKGDEMLESSSEESVTNADLEEVESKTDESGESVYEIEGFEVVTPKNTTES